MDFVWKKKGWWECGGNVVEKRWNSVRKTWRDWGEVVGNSYGNRGGNFCGFDENI